MTSDRFRDLVRQTLFRPHVAARALMEMRLPRQELWLSLGLVSILNAFVYSLSLQLNPPADPAVALMPPAFHAPVLFALFLFGALAITVVALYHVGLGLGGAAVSMDDLLVLVTWLQVLRLMVQIVIVVLAFAAPVLAAMAVMVAAIWGAYILVGFVDAAHRFGNMFKAAGVILLSLVAMVIGLSAVLSLIGIVVMRGG
ncbi:YIP1 family protein [Roseovarius ramblicola]|uniref:YIP1 family protein n=1 Tax=Roseovarius ramblicola TaxID=2022336 RepID=A0ABV5I2D2_9RHOB